MGRHDLLEALDAPAVTPLSSVSSGRPGDPGSTPRTVGEIIAQFRREQGLRSSEPLATFDGDVDAATVASDVTVDAHAHADADVAAAVDAACTVTVETPERSAAGTRPAAAWRSAVHPGGDAPHRRRAPRGGGASAVIASLTAELAETHPGLLQGSPHRRRALTHASGPARSTAPAGAARTLQPVRVTAGLRGTALRLPALATGWRVPARTPLVLAGAVAITVVVTDQTGVLPAFTGGLDAAVATPMAKNTGTTAKDTQAAAVSEDARQARSRVSRLDRTPITAPTTGGAVPASDGTTQITAAPPPDSVMKPGQTIPGDFVRPSPTGVYNSCFCSRWGTFHEGIDFAAPLGSPILAAAAGVVVEAGPASGFGNWVVIRTANGDLNIYGHMRYFYVKAGDLITAGQEIAVVGAEGQSTGPHLHFGVKVGSTNGVDGTYIDPVGWLVARGVAVGAYNQNG